MYPHLFSVPIWLFAAIAGGALGASLGGKSVRAAVLAALGAALAVGAGLYFTPVGQNPLAVQGYGVMILIGFVTAICMAEWRAAKIGIRRYAAMDIALTGCVLGILGARFFHVLMNWSEFNPMAGGSFHIERIYEMFAIWHGGLVFYGAFVTAIPYTYWYCRYNKLPAIPFLDILAPALILGQAFGRIGCFMTGCCFGRTCTLPWAVFFPGRPLGQPGMPGSPAFESQVSLGHVDPHLPYSLGVHPTQLYASLAAFLTYGFLTAYWPRRKYDGQILSLLLMMVGAMRFFEEMLRNDDPPPFPQISDSITIAQWCAIPIFLVGVGLLIYFRRRNTLYTPPPVATETK